jgi:hypothetical protein
VRWYRKKEGRKERKEGRKKGRTNKHLFASIKVQNNAVSWHLSENDGHYKLLRTLPYFY